MLAPHHRVVKEWFKKGGKGIYIFIALLLFGILLGITTYSGETYKRVNDALSAIKNAEPYTPSNPLEVLTGKQTTKDVPFTEDASSIENTETSGSGSGGGGTGGGESGGGNEARGTNTEANTNTENNQINEGTESQGLESGGTANASGSTSASKTGTTASKTGASGATYTLTLSKTSSSGSGTITSSPQGINCGATCKAPFSSGTAITLTASPGIGASFEGWGGACAFAAKALTCTLTMNSNKSISASFTSTSNTGGTTPSNNSVPSSPSTPSSYTLQFTHEGDAGMTVTSTPSGISCSSGTCAGIFPRATRVSLTYTPSNHFRFEGWGGDLGFCSRERTCTINMTSNKTGTGAFISIRTLSVTKLGRGAGTIVSSPVAISCGNEGYGTACSANFTYGRVVTLTASPASRADTFSGWGGACDKAIGPVCNVTMNGDKSVSATFTQN